MSRAEARLRETPRGPRIVVRAPATSANLGPGFDCLGLALDLWNEVVAIPAERTAVETLGGPAAPGPGENLILRAARTLADEAGRALPPLRLGCVNRVPVGRGLGSSAAAIACGVLLANRVLGEPCDPHELLDLAARMEGHPDNVAPCLLGGARVAVRTSGGHVLQTAIPVSMALHPVAFVPNVPLSTEQARQALPASVPFGDALHNVGRASLLVAALAGGDLSLLREATQDRLHQPYRAPLFPAGLRLIAAALEAGALGSFISGAGPTVLALCDSADRARRVGEALAACAAGAGVDGTTLSLVMSARGAHVADDG